MEKKGNVSVRALVWALSLILSAPALASVYAPEAVLDPPVKFVSGAPLDPNTDLQEYRIYCDGASTPKATFNPPAVSYQFQVGDFSPGIHDCYATAVAVVAKGGGESVPSASVPFDVIADQPVAPVFTITVSI